MPDHDPSNGFRRRQPLPYDWEVRAARRRRIAGRVVLGVLGLGAIAGLILFTHIFGTR